METIKIINSNSLLVSINDVCDYIQKNLNVSELKMNKIRWDFKKECIGLLHSEFKRGVVCNTLEITKDDIYLSWTRFWRLRQKIKIPLNDKIIKLFLMLDDPTEIELNPLFEEK